MPINQQNVWTNFGFPAVFSIIRPLNSANKVIFEIIKKTQKCNYHSASHLRTKMDSNFARSKIGTVKNLNLNLDIICFFITTVGRTFYFLIDISSRRLKTSNEGEN